MDAPNSRKRRDGLLPVAADIAAGAEPSAEQPLTEQDIVGLKYFDRLLPLFRRLRDEGCQRDRAGNRDLYYDQY